MYQGVKDWANVKCFPKNLSEGRVLAQKCKSDMYRGVKDWANVKCFPKNLSEKYFI